MRSVSAIFDILEPLLFKNITHMVGSFKNFVCVFVKCNAIFMLDYIYLLQHRTNELIHTGRLAFESSCHCLRICLCVCLCHCLSHHQMNPGAVLFPTMYNMLNMMLEP